MKHSFIIKSYLVSVGMSLIWAVSACSASPTATSPLTTPTSALTGLPYPGPTLVNGVPNIAYPISTETPLGTVAPQPFHLEKPVYDGATQVFGNGPVSVPIILQDVTFAGVKLSATTIGPDGRFVFNVAPLEKGHRIGVTVGDLSGTSWRPEYFLSGAYDGSEPVSVPQVGWYFDTVLVESKP